METALAVFVALTVILALAYAILWRTYCQTFNLYAKTLAELNALRQGQAVDLLVGEKGEAPVRVWLN